MELLLELQDVTRFRQADQLAAYVGLTPSQYSSADKVRMGRITKVGKQFAQGVTGPGGAAVDRPGVSAESSKSRSEYPAESKV